MAKDDVSLFSKLVVWALEHDINYDRNDSVLVFSEDKHKVFIQAFPDTDPEVRHGQARVRLSTFSFRLFWDDHFFRKQARVNDFESDIGVLNLHKGPPRYWLARESSTFMLGKDKKGIEKQFNYFFINASAFLELRKFLKEKSEQKRTGEFEFVDFFDTVRNRAVFSSSEGKGRIIVKFPNHLPELPEDQDMSAGFTELQNAFKEDNKNFPVFVKNEIIAYLKYKPEQTKAVDLFAGLPTIMQNAKVNFNVFLHELSIEKIKRDYKEYKDKYFDQINKILGKLTNQILALPIALLGAAYAMEKAGVSKEVQLLIVLALVLTSIILVFFIQMYKSELDFTDELFKKEYQEIRESDFFKENQQELIDFNTIKSFIEQKIRFTGAFISAYYWIVMVFNFLLVFLILQKMESSHELVVLIGALLLFGIIVAYLNLFCGKKIS